MKKCRAPRSRKTWMASLGKETDDYLQRSLVVACNGLKKHAHKSPRHRHDWTVYRACAIQEARKRGLDLSVAGY